MLSRVAGGDFQRPRNAGTLTRPLMKMLHSDPVKRPSMTEVHDQLAQLAAGRDRDVTEVLTARTPLTPTLTEVRPVGDRVLPVVPPTTEHPAPVEPAAAPVAAALSAPAAEPTAPQPGAAPEPPAVPPQPPAGQPPAPGSRRRRSRLAALAALLILAALVVTFVIVRQSGQDDDRTPTAAPTTSAPSSAPAPSSTPSPTPTEASTSEPAPSSTPEASTPSTTPPSTEAAGPAQGSAAEVEQALTSYYSLLPQNPQSAYDLTGPTLRAAANRGNYIAFWNRFSDVTLGPVSVDEGSLTATAPVTYVEDGRTLPEQHTFVLVRGDDGQLLIDSDRAG